MPGLLSTYNWVCYSLVRFTSSSLCWNLKANFYTRGRSGLGFCVTWCRLVWRRFILMIFFSLLLLLGLSHQESSWQQLCLPCTYDHGLQSQGAAKLPVPGETWSPALVQHPHRGRGASPPGTDTMQLLHTQSIGARGREKDKKIKNGKLLSP